MGHLQDVMLRSDTLSPTKDHWEVDGIFAFCYKVRIPLKMFWEGYRKEFGAGCTLNSLRCSSLTANP